MARYKKILDTRNKTASQFPVKIVISHKSKTRYVSTGYYLQESQWDSSKEKIKSSYKNSGRANNNINRKHTIVGEVIESLSMLLKQIDVDQIKAAVELKITEEFDDKKITPTQEISSIIEEKANSFCFYSYSQLVMQEMKKTDRAGSAQTIKDTIISLRTCS